MTTLSELKAEFNNTLLDGHCEDIETALHYYDGEADADDFIDWFTENYIHSAEIIYYHNAIKFLSEEDPSLGESMALASEYGYDVQSLNSELLATLLLQQKLSEELYSLRDSLEDYFTTLEKAA